MTPRSSIPARVPVSRPGPAPPVSASSSRTAGDHRPCRAAAGARPRAGAPSGAGAGRVGGVADEGGQLREVERLPDGDGAADPPVRGRSRACAGAARAPARAPGARPRDAGQPVTMTSGRAARAAVTATWRSGPRRTSAAHTSEAATSRPGHEQAACASSHARARAVTLRAAHQLDTPTGAPLASRARRARSARRHRRRPPRPASASAAAAPSAGPDLEHGHHEGDGDERGHEQHRRGPRRRCGRICGARLTHHQPSSAAANARSPCTRATRGRPARRAA